MIGSSSVDLVFCDPVYERIEDYQWIAVESKRILRPNRALLVFQEIGLIPATCAVVEAAGVPYRWTIAHLKLNRVKEKFGAMGFCKWEPLLWFDPNGATPRRRYLDAVQSNAFQSGDSRHPWSKALDFVEKMIEAFTKPGDSVFDPFCGSGVVPVACRKLHRNFIGCEIDPDRAAVARHWVSIVQPQMIVSGVEQLNLYDREVAHDER